MSAVQDTPTAGGGPVVGASDVVAQTTKHWNVSGTSVLVAWGLSVAGGILIILLYSWHRKMSDSSSFRMIYESRVKHCERMAVLKADGVFAPSIPTRNHSLFGWLSPAWKCVWIEMRGWRPGEGSVKKHNERMLQDLGLDATLYLRILHMLRWMFLTISILVALPALFANYQINTSAATIFGSRQDTSMIDDANRPLNATELDLLLFTAANAGGNAMSAHVIFECATVCIVVLFLHSHIAEHRELLRKWYLMNPNEVSFKTIMLTGLTIKDDCEEKQVEYGYFGYTTGKREITRPKTVLQAKEEICRLMKKFGVPRYSLDDGLGYLSKNPDVNIELTHKNMKDIANLIKDYKETAFKNFDKAMTVWLRQGSSGGRDNRGLWDKLTSPPRSDRARLEALEDTVATRLSEALKLKRKIEQAQEDARVDVEGDASDSDRYIKESETKLEAPVQTAFITLRTIRSGLTVVKHAQSEDLDFDVAQAPRAENIIWSNYDLDPAQQSTKALTAKIALVFICFVNTIPLMIITFLTNLDAAIEKVPAFRSLAESSDIWKGVFTVAAGVAPATIAALFAYVLPFIMRYLSHWSGAKTKGHLDKDVVRQLFFFLVFSNFMVFSLMGIVYEAYLTTKDQIGKEDWSAIYASLGDVPAKITKAYISNSSYWLSWFPIKTLVGFVSLLQIPRNLIKFWQAHLKPSIITYEQSGTELKEISQPEVFEWAIEVSHIVSAACCSYTVPILTVWLFGTCVGLVYTPLAPLVPICCTVYLWARSIMYLNQLTFVERVAERDGAVWKIVMYRILASLSFMVLLTGLTIALKTRSPVLSVTAFLPLVGPAYLAHALRSKDKPEDTIELLENEDEEAVTKQALPAFKHKLLNYAWAPKLELNPLDIKEFDAVKSKWKGLRELQSTAIEIKIHRKWEAQRQKEEAEEVLRKAKRQRKRQIKLEAKREKQLRREGHEKDKADRRKRRER